MATAVSFKQVGKSFGRDRALDGFNLDVPTGSIFALLGRNGTGKSTAVRILMGLLDADQGEVHVLGLDRRASRHGALDRIGYVAEDRPLYGWMTASEALAFAASFRPRWDHTLAKSLMEGFSLKAGALVRSLSRGSAAQLALIAALASRPDLMVLDEPTSGLDAVVRRQLIEQTIKSVASEGTTVLMVSHRIDEVERIADHVAIMAAGRTLVSSDLDGLKTRVSKVRAVLDSDSVPTELRGPVLSVRRLGRELTVCVEGDGLAVVTELTARGIRHVQVESPTLEEVFVAYTQGDSG